MAKLICSILIILIFGLPFVLYWELVHPKSFENFLFFMKNIYCGGE
jgi:hypothetical protein